jgi:AmmeMemoRadiSam system protein B
MTASYAYKNIKNLHKIKRVYLLGPSKLNSLIGCALSSSLGYKSPLGTLNVCFEAIKELVGNEEGFNFLLSDIDMEEEEECVEV